jgi:hypothetical protein
MIELCRFRMHDSHQVHGLRIRGIQRNGLLEAAMRVQKPSSMYVLDGGVVKHRYSRRFVATRLGPDLLGHAAARWLRGGAERHN